MISSTNEINNEWSSNNQWPAFQVPDHLDVYDLRGASQDAQLSITTMTGVINRQQPKVYLLSSVDAAFWLQEVFAQVPHDVSPATGNDVLAALLSSYSNSIRGMIIYDPNLIDSINIATMMAGQDDGIVVSPAQAQALQGSPYQLPVLADLRIYQWKNRIQAYTWAERNLLKNAAPNLVAGFDPKVQGALRSFLVATRTFIYWLDPRSILPDILNGFVSERGLMQRIFNAFPAGTTHLGWFIDEPRGVSLTSKAAMPVLASDLFENLEVWSSIQSVLDGVGGSGQMGASSAPTGPKAYLSFTISDGDNLQYDQHRMAGLWKDPVRGSMPIGWTISPSLVQTAPSLAAYYIDTASPNDELIAGPSGAGYMFPSDWPVAQLSPFLNRTGELMQAMKLDVVQVLDTGSGQAFTKPGLQAEYVNVLAPFGVKGILSGSGQAQSSWSNVSGVPVLQNLGLGDSVSKTVNLVKSASARYLNVYIMAWTMTPSDLKQVVQQLGSEYEVVTPGRLLEIIASSF
jgi:hypothetical protein